MILELATTMVLAQSCAPSVSPETMLSLVRVESAFNPFAIGINGAEALKRQPASATEAIATATELIADGYSIDMSLGQINSGNLAWLGLTVEDMFDPCTNLRAAAVVLEEGYRTSSAIHGEGQRALQMALSAYNTGNGESGFANGYVAKVLAASSEVVPAIQTQTNSPRASMVTFQAEDGTRDSRHIAPELPTSDVPAWDVFRSRAAAEAIVFE